MHDVRTNPLVAGTTPADPDPARVPALKERP